MQWAIINEKNEVINVVAYDGRSAYKISNNFKLKKINDKYKIGDRVGFINNLKEMFKK